MICWKEIEKMMKYKVCDTKVKVCDSIMGTGKSSCAINLMNEDTEHNYIYITPYLDEADRIAKACSGRRFMTPQHNGVGKLKSLHQLLANKMNIASTHALVVAQRTLFI